MNGWIYAFMYFVTLFFSPYFKAASDVPGAFKGGANISAISDLIAACHDMIT